MRTTADVQPSRVEPTALRRNRAAPAAARPAAAAPARLSEPHPEAEPEAVAVIAVRLLHLDEGLHSLRIGEIAGTPGEATGMPVPVVHVAAPFSEDGNAVDIVAIYPGSGSWLGREGGTAILRAPIDGGHVIVTAYGAPGQQAGDLDLELERLAGPPSPPLAATPAPAAIEPLRTATGGRDLQTEVLLHIERAGDRLFPGRGWVGALGRRMRIEAFSLRPLERLAPADIELKAFLPNGGETPWIPGGVLCGTRGRGMPLTGFAVRVAPQQADHVEVEYQGSFFAGGISETRRNGEPCRSESVDDPLEAVNIRLIERGADG